MQTEQSNPRSLGIDRASTLDVLRIMNDEDASVPGVVRQALSKYARSLFDLGIVRPHAKTMALARADWAGSGFGREDARRERVEVMAWTR